MTRPNITTIKTGEELKNWYWLKEELVDFCKQIQLSYLGSKFEILERIASKLDNKITTKPEKKSQTAKHTTAFNWSKAVLSVDTVITDSYTNGPNSRKFFKEQCGDKFHFSISLMNFIKNNCGKTLQDAIDEWHRLNEQKKDKNFKSEIPEGNQYNKYIRDFFADNPTMTMQQARHFWKLKRNLPLGRHIYEKSDLDLK
jgi:hypothetical protein